MRNATINILSAVDTASATGLAFDVSTTVNATFQIICADASAAGTVKLQMSNDIPVGNRATFVPTNWSDITSATSSVASGVAAPISLVNMAYCNIRAVYTRSSGGSSTISVNMNTLSA